MNTNPIETRIAQRRRCGVRKPGGLYLVSDGPAVYCGKLPVLLDVCPCCHSGIKPSRGWTWVDATLLLKAAPCHAPKCVGCPMEAGLGMAGLLWVGSCYYPSPQSWTVEAIAQGVSRRIAAVPNDFKLGTTWVLVAHRQAIVSFTAPAPVKKSRGKGQLWDAEGKPGIFHAFKPQRIEYVVRGGDSPEMLAKLRERGITPVSDQLPGTGDLPLDAAGPANASNSPPPAANRGSGGAG